MAIKVKELIKKLKEKDQNVDVEFIIVETNGRLVCMYIKKQSNAIVELLSLFLKTVNY